jgi:hypothetical protein
MYYSSAVVVIDVSAPTDYTMQCLDVMLVVSAGLFNCTTTSYPVAFRRLWATSRRSSEWYRTRIPSCPCDCEPCGDSRSLFLTNNRISGSIPDALGRLSALQ